jgi:hypothetical protein
MSNEDDECSSCEGPLGKLVVQGHPLCEGAGSVKMNEGDKRQYVTGDSQEITHPSTSPAQTGLSCEF